MDSRYISVKQGICLVALFIIGNAIIMSPVRDAGRDTWISYIIAFLATIPIFLIYAALLSFYENKNIFDIVEIVFGKFWGKIIILFFIWHAFFLGSLTLRDFGEFIITVTLPETPLVVIIICFGLLCLFAIKNRMGVLARYGEFAIIIVTAIILLTFLMSLPTMKLNNFRPVLYNGILPVFKGGVSAFFFPFSEAVILTMSFSFLRDSKSSYKVFLWGLGIGAGAILLSTLNQIAILGENNFQSSFFPIYTAIARVNIRNFFQRMELLATVVYLSAGFVKTSFCFMGACLGIAKLFGFKDYQFFATPVCFLMFSVSLFNFDSIIELFDWMVAVWNYYAIPFQVLLPVMIFVGALIKNKGARKRGEITNG